MSSNGEDYYKKLYTTSSDLIYFILSKAFADEKIILFSKKAIILSLHTFIALKYISCISFIFLTLINFDSLTQLERESTLLGYIQNSGQ